MKVQDIIIKENHDLLDEGAKGSLTRRGIRKFKDATRKARDTLNRERAAAKTRAEKAAAQLKYEKAMEAARKSARSKLGALPSVALNALNIAFTAAFLKEWYEKFEFLEQEYAKVLAGDKTTETFGNATPEEAYALAQSERRKLLGEASAVILVNLGVFSKASQFLGFIAGGAGKAVGGEAGKFLAKLPFSVTQKIAKMLEGGPVQKAALTAFIASPKAQEFLSYITFGLLDIPVKYVRDGLGLTAELALDGLNAALTAAGISAPDILKTKITPPVGDPKDPATGMAHDLGMSVQRDPKNPKILYVDRVQITDADGYQLVGNKSLANIKNAANALGRPDPTAGIPKKPGKDYNY